MSNFKQFVRKAVPIVLTVVGSASTIAAVIFAANEGPKYQKILEEKGDEMKPVEKVATAIGVFAPAIGCAAASIACGVGAHMMDMQTQASLMGATVALKEGYKKFVKENGELNGPEANGRIFMKAAEEKTPALVRNEEGEKVHKIYLKNLRDDSFDEIELEATEKELLEREKRVNIELGANGYISLNRVLELLELSEYKTPRGDDMGWSIDMLLEASCRTDYVPWLLFDYTRNDDDSFTWYPEWPSIEAFDVDYLL